jgi:hypothetical protein
MVEKAAIASETRETSWWRSVTGEPVDGFGKRNVTIGDAAGVVTGQAEIDAVPYAGEFRVVIDPFGVERDSAKKAEGLAEVLELESPGESLAAVFQHPTLRRIHWKDSCPTAPAWPYEIAVAQNSETDGLPVNTRVSATIGTIRALEMTGTSAQLAGKGD